MAASDARTSHDPDLNCGYPLALPLTDSSRVREQSASGPRSHHANNMGMTSNTASNGSQEDEQRSAGPLKYSHRCEQIMQRVERNPVGRSVSPLLLSRVTFMANVLLSRQASEVLLKCSRRFNQLRKSSHRRRNDVMMRLQERRRRKSYSSRCSTELPSQYHRAHCPRDASRTASPETPSRRTRHPSRCTRCRPRTDAW